MSVPPAVTAVVLNWRNAGRTLACIQSLLRSTYPNLRVLVVDNGSGDDSPERIVTEYPSIQILRNRENLGFARGCNVGIRESLRLGADHILLLNNDTELDPQSVDAAVEASKADLVGAVTGKIRFLHRPDVLWQAGGRIELWRACGVARGWNERDVGQFEARCDTGWTSGAMSLVPRSTFEAIGLLPEHYFFGQEEWDFSLGILRAGLRIVYEPRFTCAHEADGSYVARHPILNIYQSVRNKQILAQRHMPRALFSAWRLLYGLYVVLGYPLRAWRACPTVTAYRVRVLSAWRGFCDHRGIVRVERAELEAAAKRVGYVDPSGEHWAPPRARGPSES